MVCGKLWFGKCLTAAVSDLFISYFYLALWFGKGPAAAVSDQFISYCFTVSNTLGCRLYVYPCCNSMRIVLRLFFFSFQIVKMSCVQSSSKAIFFWEQVDLVLLILLVARHLDRKADICSFGAALENTSSKRFRHFFRLTPSTKTWKWAPPPRQKGSFVDMQVRLSNHLLNHTTETPNFNQNEQPEKITPFINLVSLTLDLQRSVAVWKSRWKSSAPTGGGDGSVVRAPDSWLKGRGFESLLERRENFLLRGRLSVLTLISVSVPPPCYRSST